MSRIEPTGELPKGVEVVLTRQRVGFWGQLGDTPSHPEMSQEDIPPCIYTFEPWLGCLWGTSCRFCYVPNLSVGFYPGGQKSKWYTDWGRWLLPKPDITARLRQRLLNSSGNTRPAYLNASIFMSAKTDPFLPLTDNLKVTLENLKVFSEAQVFLMCQTRSPKVVEDPEIFNQLQKMARYCKVGVSFSVSTDILEEQRKIEQGGLTPEKRLEAMKKLKEAGIFVSAAVCPLMPFSAEFPRRIVECAHHASLQILGPSGFGSASPKQVLSEVYGAVPDYGELEQKLVEGFTALGENANFSWGVGSKGFVGGFLAARRFYDSPASGRTDSSQLELSLCWQPAKVGHFC